MTERYRTFVCRMDEGAFYLKNSLGEFLAQDCSWSSDATAVRLFSKPEDAWIEGELVQAISVIPESSKTFEGRLTVHLRPAVKNCSVRRMVSYLRDALDLKLNTQLHGSGPTWRPCLTTVEVGRKHHLKNAIFPVFQNIGFATNWLQPICRSL